MSKTISKSKFKPHALKYFREIERTKKEIIITDHDKPVLKIIPFSEDIEESLKILRNSILKYENPTEPVGLEEWETLK